MFAQGMVNQKCSIELCSSATLFAVCGAEAELTTGGCFLSLRRHPRHPDHIERAGVVAFWLTPRNLPPNLMEHVCRVSDFFSSDEGWLYMGVAARSLVARWGVK